MNLMDVVTKFYVEELLILSVTAGTFAIKYHNKRYRKREAKIDALSMGTQAMLRHHIFTSYNRVIKRKKIPLYELDHIEAMFASYHELGGNGSVDIIMSRIRNMPTEDDMFIQSGKEDTKQS